MILRPEIKQQKEIKREKKKGEKNKELVYDVFVKCKILSFPFTVCVYLSAYPSLIIIIFNAIYICVHNNNSNITITIGNPFKKYAGFIFYVTIEATGLPSLTYRPLCMPLRCNTKLTGNISNALKQHVLDVELKLCHYQMMFNIVQESLHEN